MEPTHRAACTVAYTRARISAETDVCLPAKICGINALPCFCCGRVSVIRASIAPVVSSLFNPTCLEIVNRRWRNTGRGCAGAHLAMPSLTAQRLKRECSVMEGGRLGGGISACMHAVCILQKMWNYMGSCVAKWESPQSGQKLQRDS